MAITLEQLMNAISGQESGGRYDALNDYSGASGKFQFMPDTWRSVAPMAGLPPDAPMTPENQEAVARAYMGSLWEQSLARHGGDEQRAAADVASIWYSGQPISAFDQEALTRPQAGGHPSIADYASQVVGRLGMDAGGTSALPGSSPAERAATNKEIQGLREQYTKMLAEYQRDPNGNYTLADIQDMAALINDRQKSLDDIEATGYGRQQDAFANSIALGDYQARQADRAWEKYLANRSSAETAAQVEIDRRAKHNLAQGDIEAARQANFGQGPQASTKTYLPANYGDLLDEYSKKFGADTPPSSDPASYGGPALPGQGGFPVGLPAQIQPGQLAIYRDDWQIEKPASDFDARDYLDSTVTPIGPRRERRIYRDDWQIDPKAVQRPAESGGTGNFILDNIQQNLIDPFGMPKDLGQWLGGSDRKILGMKMGQGNAPGRAVDKKIKKWWLKGRKTILGFAEGTMNAPGGLARLGEKGPETMIDPRTGQPVRVGEMGPEVRDVPQGAAVYPNDIPPDEAYAHYQMQQMASQQNPRSVNMAEAQARASDPQLQQKVMAALQDAVVARSVSNPPATPGLAGVWTKPDPWADWRAVNDPLGQGVV